MNAKDTIEIDKLLNKVYLLVILLGTVVSVSSISLSYLVGDPFRGLLQLAGSVVAGAVASSLLQVKLLGDFFKAQTRLAITPNLEKIEASVVSEIQKIIPQTEHELVKSISGIETKVSDATRFLTDGIGVLSGAKAAGIVNIFPNRYFKSDDTSVELLIQRELQNENNTIKVMGISLGDYFLDRGVLHKQFIEAVESKNYCIQALMMDPKCDALKNRARWEAGSEYSNEPAFFDSTTFIETDGAARIARRMQDKYRKQFQVKLYSQAPVAFILLTTRFGLIEAYHYADRGSNVPILQVQAGSPLYATYDLHFNRLWDVSFPISNYEPLGKSNKVT